MIRDWDTKAQCDLFDQYLKDTEYGRQVHKPTGTLGYLDEEWLAFQYGWNAAKKHFGIEQ